MQRLILEVWMGPEILYFLQTVRYHQCCWMRGHTLSCKTLEMFRRYLFILFGFLTSDFITLCNVLIRIFKTQGPFFHFSEHLCVNNWPTSVFGQFPRLHPWVSSGLTLSICCHYSPCYFLCQYVCTYSMCVPYGQVSQDILGSKSRFVCQSSPLVTLSLIDFHDLLKTVINEAMYFQTCQIYTINPKLLLVKSAWTPCGAPVSEQPPVT